MLARWARTWDKLLLPLLFFLGRLGIRPNGLTISSLVIMIVTGMILAQGWLVAGGCVLFLGGILDSLDGELARAIHCETRFGAFLDSVLDHCGDFAVYLGLLWLYINQNAQIEIILIFFALFGSVFGSQVRSRAGMLGIDTKNIGLFTRFERILVMSIGLLADKVIFSLWLLAIMNNFSAFQRLVFIIRAKSAHQE
jgi:CDP-diacylglycerol---glycerol-3-phosphate 3-phosphatidyltransferase